MMQLVFTAVFFFLLAVILMLVVLRLTGYLGEPEPEYIPVDSPYDWLEGYDGLPKEMYQIEGDDGLLEVHLLLDGFRLVYVFDEAHRLLDLFITDVDGV